MQVQDVERKRYAPRCVHRFQLLGCRFGIVILSSILPTPNRAAYDIERLGDSVGGEPAIHSHSTTVSRDVVSRGIQHRATGTRFSHARLAECKKQGNRIFRIWFSVVRVQHCTATLLGNPQYRFCARKDGPRAARIESQTGFPVSTLFPGSQRFPDVCTRWRYVQRL